MMRNSIKHEKLVRKNDMKWHPWNIMFHMDVSSGWTFDWFDPHLQHHCFLASGHEACCQEQPLDPFENTWEAAVSRTFQWLRPSLQLKGRCLEVKFLWSILGWRHPNKNSASFQINKCNSFVHFAVRGAWYRRTLDGSYNTWMHRITHTSTLLKRLHLVVSWGLWNLETCQRDCVFSTRIWTLQRVSGFCWVELTSDSPVKLMPWHHVCLFLDQDVLHVEEPRWQSYFWPSSMMMWWSWESCIQAGWKSVALRTALVTETEGWKKWMSSTHEHEHYKMTKMILHSISCPRDWRRISAFLQNQIQPSAGIL